MKNNLFWNVILIPKPEPEPDRPRAGTTATTTTIMENTCTTEHEGFSKRKVVDFLREFAGIA